jgi:hypothetical protein
MLCMKIAAIFFKSIFQNVLLRVQLLLLLILQLSLSTNLYSTVFAAEIFGRNAKSWVNWLHCEWRRGLPSFISIKLISSSFLIQLFQLIDRI